MVVAVLLGRFHPFNGEAFMCFLTVIGGPNAIYARLVGVGQATARLTTPRVDLPIVVPGQAEIFPAANALRAVWEYPETNDIYDYERGRSVI